MLVVWDSLSATPVRTFLNPHPNGVKTMDLSADNQYIATLGADTPQTVSLWDWTDEKQDGPICSLEFQYTDVFQGQHWIKFNPDNPYELCCNGDGRVLFLNWSPGLTKFNYYSPPRDKKDFATPDRERQAYTKTVFLPGTQIAVTGTTGGDLLVWDRTLIIMGIGEQDEKRLVKIVTLNQEEVPGHFDAITMLLTVDNTYLVVGNSDGTIRFYDFYFKAEAWFEKELNLSTIKSISFSNKQPVLATQGPGAAESGSKFRCSDFIVADSSAMVVQLKSTIFEAIDKSKKRGQTLMVGIKSSISAIAVHPHKSLLALAGAEGFIIIQDYMQKGDPKIQQYEQYTKDTREKKGEPQASQDKNAKGKKGDGDPAADKKEEKSAANKLFTTLEFTPDGDELLVGQSNGIIKIIDPETGKYKELAQPLKLSDDEAKCKQSYIQQMIVSSDGKYFACADSRNCVSLFRKERNKPGAEWEFHGKVQSHQVGITSICFGEELIDQGDDRGGDEEDLKQHRLFSVGADRRCFEYDVAKSDMREGLPIVNHDYFRVELESRPTACIWYPQLDSKEGLILTANDEYKMKLWNPTARTSRRTCLGPTYGGEIVKLKLLNMEN